MGRVFFAIGGFKNLKMGLFRSGSWLKIFMQPFQKILFHTNLSFPTFMVMYKPGLFRIWNGGRFTLTLWVCPYVTLQKVVVKLKLFSAGCPLGVVVVLPFPTKTVFLCFLMIWFKKVSIFVIFCLGMSAKTQICPPTQLRGKRKVLGLFLEEVVNRINDELYSLFLLLS